MFAFAHELGGWFYAERIIRCSLYLIRLIFLAVVNAQHIICTLISVFNTTLFMVEVFQCFPF
jgi:hypothetical protein